MAIVKEQMVDKRSGKHLNGFFVRNRTGKALAIGADGAFVFMMYKRYANDKPLVAAIERLVGMTMRK